jgi:hypothetical protein
VDGGQHEPPVGLTLLEGTGWFEPGERIGLGHGFGQPGGGRGGEGGRDVDLGDVFEPGGAEQAMVVAAHGYGSGPGGPCPSAGRGRQARRFNDGVEADASAGP